MFLVRFFRSPFLVLCVVPLLVILMMIGEYRSNSEYFGFGWMLVIPLCVIYFLLGTVYAFLRMRQDRFRKKVEIWLIDFCVFMTMFLPVMFSGFIILLGEYIRLPKFWSKLGVYVFGFIFVGIQCVAIFMLILSAFRKKITS